MPAEAGRPSCHAARRRTPGATHGLYRQADWRHGPGRVHGTVGTPAATPGEGDTLLVPSPRSRYSRSSFLQDWCHVAGGSDAEHEEAHARGQLAQTARNLNAARHTLGESAANLLVHSSWSLCSFSSHALCFFL